MVRFEKFKNHCHLWAILNILEGSHDIFEKKNWKMSNYPQFWGGRSQPPWGWGIPDLVYFCWLTLGYLHLKFRWILTDQSAQLKIKFFVDPYDLDGDLWPSHLQLWYFLRPMSCTIYLVHIVWIHSLITLSDSHKSKNNKKMHIWPWRVTQGQIWYNQ